MLPDLDTIFNPWRQALGADAKAFHNPVARLVGMCELLATDRGVGIDPLALRTPVFTDGRCSRQRSEHLRTH